MNKELNLNNLRTPGDKDKFKSIIIRESFLGNLTIDLAQYISVNKNCRTPYDEFRIHKTYMGIPLIQDFDENVICSLNEDFGDKRIEVSFLSDPVYVKGEIPVVNEVIDIAEGCYHSKLICHEIINDKLDLDKIIEKYEDTGCILCDNIFHPLKCGRSPVVVWSWQDEIKNISSILSKKEKELIRAGIINLVPLEVLIGLAPEYFPKSVREKFCLR